MLSGDVHHAYIARPEYGDDVRSAVYQLTCSPLHNRVPLAMKLMFRGAWSRFAERSTRVFLGVVARVPQPSVEWTRLVGPYFGNDLMTLATGRARRRRSFSNRPGRRPTARRSTSSPGSP